jgi:EAL domain-containing protein (putative c-di-GMP-specific phosphodiesterase class I)
MYRLTRFRYLTFLLAVAAVVSSLSMAALVGWRNLSQELNATAYRAVFNADRLLDRTAADLSMLDGVRGFPCDASTTRTLQEAVYKSLSQIREVGLVRDGRLYCTNFGAPPLEIPVPKHLTEPGVHIDVGPNAVIPNNTSLFVYVSRESGTAVDALFNPQVLAEFERDFSYTGFGRLSLYVAPHSTAAKTSSEKLTAVYTVGELRSGDSAALSISKRYTSQRSGFSAVAEVSPRAWWFETLAILPLMSAVFGVAALIAFFIIQSWLARGNLDRLRYLGAMQRKEFVMHYQPIIEADTLRIVGVEALLRWQHRRRGLLRAAQFADIFSHDALAPQLVLHTLALVQKDLQTLPSNTPLWCAVNIAPTLLGDNAVLTDIIKHAGRAGVDRVRLEITERAPIDDYAEVLLHEMRANGMKVGLDDLGTGYANLAQLQRMPFDFIKIDGMLVRGIQNTDGVSPVVKSLIDLARTIGCDVIVEGVETSIQAEALIAAGATHLQGFYYGAAKPMAEIVELLEKSAAVKMNGADIRA